MLWIKRTFISLLLLLLLVAVGLAWLLASLDVNRYKPQLEQLAAKQGVALRLSGDIGWQLWPNIGLRLDGVQLAPLPLPDQPLVQAESIAVRVALRPLLQKRVEAQEIALIDPQIELSVDQQGRGNWELLLDALQAEAERQESQPPQLEVPVDEKADQELQLALNRLRIVNGRIHYRDATSQSEYSVDRLHLSADNIAADGKPGRLEAHARVTGTPLQQAVELRLDSSLALDPGFNGVRLQPATLRLESGTARAQVRLRGHARRAAADQPWQLQFNLAAQADPLRPWLAVVGSEMVTQSRSALRSLRLETDISGDENRLTLEPLQIQLDNNTLSGNAQLRSGDIPGVELTLRGGAITLDDYLPPPSPEEAAPAEEIAAEAPPVPLPMESLRGFDARLDLALEQLNAVDLKIEQPQLLLTANNGNFQLQKLSAGILGGELNTSGRMDARGTAADVELSGGLSAVELSQVQKLLSDSERVRLSGQTDLTWAAQTRGADTAQLQNNLRAALQLNSHELAIAPFNLERGMCQLVSYVEKTPLPEREWPERTRLQDLRAGISVAGDRAEVQQINAGIENIALTGDGVIDLEKEEFDFSLGLALTGERSSRDGCTVSNERWRNRPLPLRCRDNFADAGATSCRPDSRRLDDLVRDELKYQAEKKYGSKVEDAVEDVKERLKGLFRR